EKPLNLTDGISYGNISSSLQIVVYSSFQCPDCKTLHENLNKVIEKYVDEQDLYYIFKPVDIKSFPYDQMIYSKLSEEEENLETVNRIFEKQEEWSKAKSESEVKQILNLSDIDENLTKEREQSMENIMEDLEDRGISQVPTFFINGKKFVGLYSEEELRGILEKEDE